ncbi:hypothetical protein F5Y19DRAFT_488748 [Xylariaceae sp. FL1651]|nr:hypothetical protein F5Y19DRAFT_488748 [Xylariaceae sp. FL1651]
MILQCSKQPNALRHELALDTANAASLDAIEAAAFVICLDDESPLTAGEQHTQFLLGRRGRFLSNRWLDKPLQLVHVVGALKASGASYKHTSVTGQPEGGFPVRELLFHVKPTIIQHIHHLEATFNSSQSPYTALEHRHVKAKSLNRALFRESSINPNSGAHLAVLLALCLVDGRVRPAWEVMALKDFARGRVDWVQTVTPAVHEFLITAAASIRDGGTLIMSCARSAILKAAASHAQLVATAARGYGYVGHLYMLRGLDDATDMLFQTAAWEATRRGGKGQDLKLASCRLRTIADTSGKREVF